MFNTANPAPNYTPVWLKDSSASSRWIISQAGFAVSASGEEVPCVRLLAADMSNEVRILLSLEQVQELVEDLFAAVDYHAPHELI